MDCYVIHQHSTCHIKQEKTHRAILSYNGCLVSDRDMFTIKSQSKSKESMMDCFCVEAFFTLKMTILLSVDYT